MLYIKAQSFSYIPSFIYFLASYKGANSAVSASLLDAKTIFTGRFGSDANGKILLSELQAKSVDTSSCKIVSGW